MTPIPVSDFQVPAGMIAVTLDLHRCELVTVALEAGQLEPLLNTLETQFEIKRGGRRLLTKHLRMRAMLAVSVRRAQARGDDVDLRALGIVALWLALNHPDRADTMRRHVADSLRRNGRAHVTVAHLGGVWAFAEAERFVPLDALLAAGSRETATVSLAWERPLAARAQH